MKYSPVVLAANYDLIINTFFKVEFPPCRKLHVATNWNIFNIFTFSGSEKFVNAELEEKLCFTK